MTTRIYIEHMFTAHPLKIVRIKIHLSFIKVEYETWTCMVKHGSVNITNSVKTLNFTDLNDFFVLSLLSLVLGLQTYDLEHY